MRNAQTILDKHKTQLQSIGLMTSVTSGKRITKNSLIYELVAGENFVLYNDNTGYLLAGCFNQTLYAIGDIIKEIDVSIHHLEFAKIFSTSSVILYKDNQKEAQSTKKYDLIPAVFNGVRCFQLISKGFGQVQAGVLGGYVENIQNLSDKGNCWIQSPACVFGTARVRDDAVITGNSRLYDGTVVCGTAQVSNTISHNSNIKGNSQVISGELTNSSVVDSTVHGCLLEGTVSKKSTLSHATVKNSGLHEALIASGQIDGSDVYGEIRDNAIVKDSKILKDAKIIQNAQVVKSKIENSTIQGYSFVEKAYVKDAVILGSSIVKADVCGNVILNSCEINKKFVGAGEYVKLKH